MGQSTQASNLASQLGGSALGSIVGEGIGLMFNGVNNQNQLNQQNNLDSLQLYYNNLNNQQNEAEQVKLFNDTSYPDQVAELNKAGLNPALLYHGAGAGGTTLSGPSIQGAMAPSVSSNQTAQLAIASQEAQADINLKNAQAANIQAQTPGAAGLQQAQTLNLLQGVDNMQAQQALTQVQTTLTSIQTQIQGQTIEDQVAQIRAAASQAQQQFQIIQRNNTLDQATLQTKIDQANANLISTYINNNLQKSNIQVNQADIQQISNQIIQSRAQTSINRAQTTTGQEQQQTNQGILELQNLMFKYKMDQGPIDDFMNGLHSIMPSIITTQKPGATIIR